MNANDNLIQERKAATLYLQSFKSSRNSCLLIKFSTEDVLIKWQGLPFQYKSRASVSVNSTFLLHRNYYVIIWLTEIFCYIKVLIMDSGFFDFKEKQKLSVKTEF